jgi:hypothetical protein
MADSTPSTPAPSTDHCWDAVHDSTAYYLPLDPFAPSIRYIAATAIRAEKDAEGKVVRHVAGTIPFKCCWCSQRSQRVFEIRRVDAKGKHANGVHGPAHEVFEHVAADPLPKGPCLGRPTPQATQP